MRQPARIEVVPATMVVLIGPTSSGKSTFAHRHFLPSEILSSDAMRVMVADRDNDPGATKDAFAILHAVLAARLRRGLTCVVDATNVQAEARRSLLEIARRHHARPIAVVFNLPEGVCQDRNEARPDRGYPKHVIRNHLRDLRQSLRGLAREFRRVYDLGSVAEIDTAQVERVKSWADQSDRTGPFDVIGDVHGCLPELMELMAKLGYPADPAHESWPDRTLLFLGDLVDRGPDSPGVLKLVMELAARGRAICVPGNHDARLVRKLRGRDVALTHGLKETLEQLEPWGQEFKDEAAAFIDGLISHCILDGGRLVAAHAGLKEEMHGRSAGSVREFALFGETTGETDEFGLPQRLDWASGYRGQAAVVYGHTPVDQAEWRNNTINLDTGCVFGGELTALRYPEMELVAVKARRAYAEARRPVPGAAAASVAEEAGELPKYQEIAQRLTIPTRTGGSVTIHELEAAAALEAMSRFAADPRWLVYLPPAMCPCESSSAPGYLEHPAEALNAYRRWGIRQVVCQEKHMGSRAVVVVGREPESLEQRFGVSAPLTGVVLSRTGRRFFGRDEAVEGSLLAVVREAASNAGLWEELATDWMVLDCELMPWSAKAQELIERQYAPAAISSIAASRDAASLFGAFAARTGDSTAAALADRMEQSHQSAVAFAEVCARYCWPVESPSDYRLAPFHLMAAEGRVFSDQTHLWHSEVLSRLCEAGSQELQTTRQIVVDLDNESSCEAAVEWWLSLTEAGGEGMVVKPLEFLARGPKGLIQPALKCRGREYLRMIYGADYLLPENLERLRVRNVGPKGAIALKEFRLGLEGLARFVEGAPLARVHECAFGVLAMESEAVDPRL